MLLARKWKAAKTGNSIFKNRFEFRVSSFEPELALILVYGANCSTLPAKPNTPLNVVTAQEIYVAEEKHFRAEGESLVAVTPATPAAVDTTEALVYIYRPGKMAGKALEPSVFVDDTELARMDNGRYSAIKLKPGKHIIHMTDDKKGYAIDMGPGKTYYFRIGIEMGMWKGHGKITLDDADRAIKEIKKIKFIGQDKIKANTIVVDIPVQ